MPIRPENRDRYPADRPLRSYFVRFVRARGCCEWCGARHGATGFRSGKVFVEGDADMLVAMKIKPVKIVLTTAHVFDSAPEASSLLNLAALCQKCHLGHDAEIHKANRQRSREQRTGQLRLIA